MGRLDRAKLWYADLRWFLANMRLVVHVCQTIHKDIGTLHVELRHVNERFIDLRQDVYNRVDTHQSLGHPKR